jgi:cysteinyl-tRNA synthetase
MARDPALAAATKRSLLSRFDRILGLGVDKWRRAELPEELKRLLDERDAARARRDYATADELRARLAAAGVEIMDTPSGTKWQYNPKR